MKLCPDGIHSCRNPSQDCADCDICNLNYDRMCDNCGKCLENGALDYISVQITDIADSVETAPPFEWYDNTENFISTWEEPAKLRNDRDLTE